MRTLLETIKTHVVMNWDYPLKPKQQTPHDPNPVPQKGRGEEEDAERRRKEQYQTCLVFFFLQQ